MTETLCSSALHPTTSFACPDADLHVERQHALVYVQVLVIEGHWLAPSCPPTKLATKLATHAVGRRRAADGRRIRWNPERGGGVTMGNVPVLKPREVIAILDGLGLH